MTIVIVGGMNKMKDYVMKLVEGDIGRHTDDLYRAETAFSRFTVKEMQEEHGQSGVSRLELLNKYTKALDDAKKAREWLRSI